VKTLSPFSSLAGLALTSLILGLMPAGWAAAAPVLTTLHAFTGADGATPTTDLLFDTSGDLYGAASAGGARGLGAVFALSPPATPGGSWTQTTLYAFTGAADGARPAGSLLFDTSGGLYGTTQTGGPAKAGAVFKLTPPPIAGGSWTETTLYTFAGGADGTAPGAGLVFDTFGNLYGTTTTGGAYGAGTVFELTAPAAPGGSWTKTVLFNFHDSENGGRPASNLIFDTTGALYGATQVGGAPDFGVVFKLSPPPSPGGSWTQSTLHGFTGAPDGAGPAGNLVFDTAGALYGVTQAGGASNFGTVFRLAPPATPGGAWTETTLHGFTGGSDGGHPRSGLMFDMTGALFGTTTDGAAFGFGAVFKLAPPATPGKAWKETVLYHFKGGGDGAGPRTGLTVDGSGAVFGTTAGRVPTNAGTVFELMP
jgi:uncharacterized repeat protein (TIGR03803 family)